MKTATGLGDFVKTYLSIGAAISLMALVQTQIQTQALLKFRTRYKWVILMMVFAANVALDLYIVLRCQRTRIPGEDAGLRKSAGFLGVLAGLALIIVPVPLFLLARADFFGRGLEAFFRLFWLFWWIGLIQAVGMKLATGLDWWRAFIAVLLLDGMAAQIRTLSVGVSNYPFSMGWSEASRYYYGSLVFSRSVYGHTLPLSVMHGSRYLLQSLPFLVNGMTIWGARLWQVMLWIGLTLGSAWSLVRRLGIRDWLTVGLTIGWLFLYYFQGAVYYHLQVCVVMVMLGVAPNRPWRSLAVIAAASIWAGMSRVNWFPVPAMLAIALYCLEESLGDTRQLWKYARTPLVWGAGGVIAAMLGQAFYVAISGSTNLEVFASSFNSALLWYRWLPSPTNPIGIIPGVIVTSLPLAALIAWRWRAKHDRPHPLRLLALGTMLLVLLLGGLVVSTKIGGGGDLHNMDAYMVLLAIIGVYSLWGNVQAEHRPQPAAPVTPWAIMVLMVAVPVAFSLLRLGNAFSYDAVRAASDLSILRREVQDYSKSGEVLFMYERHLLTFGMIPGVHMVPEYEVVTLMEMAISENRAYLGQLYEDLAAHRFSAIVAHPQNLGVETADFIEENNAWTRLIAQPLLCQYKPALTLDYSNIQILVPRARPCPEFPPQIGEPQR
jgi:hypothetical protein